MKHRLFLFVVLIVALATVFVTVPVAGASNAEPRANVFAYGRARFFGSTGVARLAHPIVGIASTPSGRGYWLVASDGGMFSFGDARFRGSTGAMSLNKPIVGMASTPSGRGYWLVASDGGMFSFGDARFRGSTGAMSLNKPIVGMASTPSGRGYWLVASDGGMFGFGDARFHGSPASRHLAEPIVGLTSTPTGHGYRLATRDGRVFSYGDARVGMRARASGARAAGIGSSSIVGIAAGKKVRSYWLAADGGAGSKAEAAIDWFEARMGSRAYEGLCETAVELAYGTINQYPTAAANWWARADKHFDWQNAPRGALVFYDTSAQGHVAISLGNGQVVSTSINHHIAVAPTGFLQRPLGWSLEPW